MNLADDLKIVLLTMIVMSLVAGAHMWRWVRATIVTARRRDLRLCMDCGYDLNGNVSGRCPECGCPRDDLPRRPLDRPP